MSENVCLHETQRNGHARPLSGGGVAEW